MVKFKSAGDQGYQRILGWINSMRNEISTTTANTTLSVNEDGEEDQGRGLSRLHMAAAAPSTAYLKQVLRESPRGTLNAADGPPHHRTPLHMAIFNNLPENIAILLEAGADVKKPAFLKNEWWPPLFLAAVLGNAEAVEALISVGRLDPDQPFSDTNGNTALHVAAVNRKPNVARTLLRLGADPWSKDEKNGWDNGWTALDCAFNNKDEEMIDILQQAIEQRAQRYQEVFEPSQSSVDRSDVYDDGRRSPQGSVIAPETYSTNFMPFQGSTGFSSVDDAPPKTLSSATGLGTHGIPESESSNIERACSDDQHVSDTMSIHTDGREHNLDLGTKLSLTGAFASHIVENLTPQQLDNLFDQPDAIAPIAELIGDFSVLLGMSIADDDIRSRAVTFVRHQRVDIAKGLASAAKAWIPSTTDQVSMEEKLKMLHFGDTEPAQYDDPNLEKDCPGSPHDEGQLDSLYTGDETPELRDVVLGKNFVLGSEEFPWMIDCIRRYESLTQTGKIFSSVRSGIARTIESHSEHIEFSLDWDIAKMLDQQYYGESRSQICLSDMIVYNGTSSLCYASTTSEYVRQIWPALGVAVVRCFDHALVSADGTSTLALQDARLHVKLEGATTTVSINATTGESTSQSRIHMLEVRSKTFIDMQRFTEAE